jgi:uncharacterized protein (TIGR02145 family)
MIRILIVMAILFCHCRNTYQNNTVIDVDGNIYRTVVIGKQVWMAENLRVTRFRNGDQLRMVTDGGTWSHFPTAAYCHYNNDTNKSNLYGLLYNWHVVNDSRNIAPEGWHLPTEQELATLITFAGGDTVAAGKLKDTGHWLSPNAGAGNEYNFSALPGGYRFSDGAFHTLGSNGYWWSLTGSYSMYAWTPRIYLGFADVKRDQRFENYGLAVRCVKD